MAGNKNKCGGSFLEKSPQQFKLSSCEAKVLKVARYYFMTFADPSKQAWLDANDYSIKHFSADQGPYVALAILSAIQSMREARQSEFKFNNPECKVCSKLLTEHEKGLINTIRCKVNGEDQAASAHAFILCEGNDSSQFLTSTLILAAICFPDEVKTVRRGLKYENF